MNSPFSFQLEENVLNQSFNSDVFLKAIDQNYIPTNKRNMSNKMKNYSTSSIPSLSSTADSFYSRSPLLYFRSNEKMKISDLLNKGNTIKKKIQLLKFKMKTKYLLLGVFGIDSRVMNINE